MKYITSLSGPCCPGPEYLIDLSKSNVPLTTGGVENAHMKEKIIVIIDDPEFVDITTIKTYPDTKITPLGDGKYEIVMPSSDIKIYGVSNGVVPEIPAFKAKFGDIYLTNGKIVSLETYLINKNKLELEGIVVTSALSDNKIRVMSPSFYKGPFSNTLTSFPVPKIKNWDFPVYHNGTLFNTIYKLKNGDGALVTDSDYTYESQQQGLGWKYDNFWIPIPGTEEYYTTIVTNPDNQQEIEIDNILTHIDGEQNCKDILNEQGTIEDFPILSAIPEGYYIPSVGELGYIIMNLSKLNDILEELELEIIDFKDYYTIWTSTIEVSSLLRMTDTQFAIDARLSLNSSHFAIPVKSVEANDPRLTVKYNVEDDTDTTQLYAYSSEEGMTGATMFDKVEIDGTEVSIEDLDGEQGTYQLTEGKHTVKYTLKDPTIIGVFMDESTGTVTVGATFAMMCPALTSVTIPDSVTSIGYNAFYNCTSLASVTIPDSVTSIGESAFENCSSLTSVTIGNGVTEIGYNAFASCTALTSITIPNSVTTIGSTSFFGCSSLISITIPDSVTTIDEQAFDYCGGLTSLTIGSGVTSIGDGAFDGCDNITSLTINSNTAFNSNQISWLYSGIEELIIGDNVTTEIGTETFMYSNLRRLVIGNGVPSIDSYAFAYCGNLTSATIGSGVTSIGDYAFSDCYALTSVTIPNSVTDIGERVFINCSSLESVTIGNSVTSIGEWTFATCSGLTSVTINATTPPTLGSSAFDGTNDCFIYVQAQSVDTYKAASGWSEYADRIQAIP